MQPNLVASSTLVSLLCFDSLVSAAVAAVLPLREVLLELVVVVVVVVAVLGCRAAADAEGADEPEALELEDDEPELDLDSCVLLLLVELVAGVPALVGLRLALSSLIMPASVLTR